MFNPPGMTGQLEEIVPPDNDVWLPVVKPLADKMLLTLVSQTTVPATAGLPKYIEVANVPV